MKSKFDYISFFSGLGGFDTGLNQIGGNCVLAAEWEEKIRFCYNLIHGLMPKGDIRDLTWRDIQKSKLWTFGFPCQDLSVANMNGKERKKLDGEKSGLFYEVMRLAEEVRDNEPTNLPDFLWAENVEDLGPLLPVLRAEFHKIGYDMTFKLYNTKYWGLAQSRPRFYVIGIRKDLYLDIPDHDSLLPKEDQNPMNVPKLKDFLESDPDPKFIYDLDKIEYEPLPVRQHKQGELNQLGILHGNGWLDYMKRVYSIEGVAPTLHTCQGGHRQAKVVDEKGNVRRLTAKEYLRLQGFSDEVYDKLKENKVSNTQIFLMAGNAVSVNLVVAVGKCLYPYLIKGNVEERQEEQLKELYMECNHMLFNRNMVELLEIREFMKSQRSD